MNKNNVYLCDDEKFVNAILSSSNIRQALLKLSLNATGANYRSFVKRANQLKCDISHLITKNQKETRNSLSDQMIISTCKECFSRRSVLQTLNLTGCGVNVNWIDNKIRILSIDISHWTGSGHLRGKTHNWTPKIPLQEILTQDSKYTGSNHLKNRLVKEKLLPYRCSNKLCYITEWLEKPISLQLDHINGVHTDNRLENLRLLCPNCHSQTDNYCRKK